MFVVMYIYIVLVSLVPNGIEIAPVRYSGGFPVGYCILPYVSPCYLYGKMRHSALSVIPIDIH